MGNLDETSWFEMFCSQSVETVYEAGESYSLQGDRLRNVGYIISGEANAVSYSICLLYTSDAADDLLCVDLGGRRII